MKREQILPVLARWKSTLSELETQMSALGEVVGSNPDSALFESVYGLAGAYTQQVADALSWDAEALTDFWLNHEFGEKPMRAGLNGEVLRSIASIEDMARLIADDHEKATQEDA